MWRNNHVLHQLSPHPTTAMSTATVLAVGFCQTRSDSYSSGVGVSPLPRAACHGEATVALLLQSLVRQWHVVRHHIRRVHLGTVVHDPHLGGRRARPRQVWSTTHRVAPGRWLLQFRMPGQTVVVAHTAQHPYQQQLAPGGMCGALRFECVHAVAVGSAFSKVRATSVVPRVGLYQKKDKTATKHAATSPRNTSRDDEYGTCPKFTMRAIHRTNMLFQVRTTRKSTPSKPLHITHGLVLDVPCHSHCSFTPLASRCAATCCSMSHFSCLYRFHRYRFWTLGSASHSDAQHQCPNTHTHTHTHTQTQTANALKRRTCTPLH